MTEWQPIETAPKLAHWMDDQPTFLVWDGTEVWCIDAGGYPKTNGCGCCTNKIKFTHWMPLPEPPK